MKNISVFGAVVLTAFFIWATVFGLFPKDEEEQSIVAGTESNVTYGTSVIQEGLYVPWSIAFFRKGEFAFTERNGFLKLVGPNPISIRVPEAMEIGEGGLLGLAIHPDFSTNHFIYLYFTTQAGEKILNRVVRYEFTDYVLIKNKVVLDNIPGGSVHNGGAIAFGPDNYLYISTGDSGQEELAQDKNSLGGKILRINDDGSIPSDNPFGNEVYSFGHRNPQGLAWDYEGNLWETEHGRSGVTSGLDELNLITRGSNYGWPIVQGDEKREGMVAPMINSGSLTWAPSGLAFRGGNLFFAGLRGESLYKVNVLPQGKLGPLTSHFAGKYGRLRGVVLGPDDFIYFSTSNRDGRGKPQEGDDKILKLLEVSG